jgi:hypothetical protein
MARWVRLCVREPPGAGSARRLAGSRDPLDDVADGGMASCGPSTDIMAERLVLGRASRPRALPLIMCVVLAMQCSTLNARAMSRRPRPDR